MVSGSSTKASFGAVSGIAVDVTQSGSGPASFVAVQPAGRAGAVTESKSSKKTVVQGVEVGVGVACANPVETQTFRRMKGVTANVNRPNVFKCKVNRDSLDVMGVEKFSI